MRRNESAIKLRNPRNSYLAGTFTVENEKTGSLLNSDTF